MGRTVSFALILTAADGLAINSYNPFDLPCNCFGPPKESIMELFRIDHLEYPIDGVMGGNPAGKFQNCFQPFPDSAMPMISFQEVMEIIAHDCSEIVSH